MVEAEARLFIIPLQGSHPLTHIQMFATVKLWFEDSMINALFPYLKYSAFFPVVSIQRPGKGFIVIMLEIVLFYSFKIRIPGDSNRSKDHRISIFILVLSKNFK